MSTPANSPELSVTTASTQLGIFGPIFRNREIAVGVDAAGQHVLARPSKILVDSHGDPKNLRGLLKLARAAAGTRRKNGENDPPEVAGIVAFDVQVDTPPLVGPEAIWRIEPASAAVDQANSTDAGSAMLNSVFFGAPGSITGNPLGVEASYAGEFPFVGDVVTLANARKVLLSTAQPSSAPPTLPQALNISGKERPRVLILDTGLRTEGGNGVRPEHPALQSCRCHSGWRSATGVDVIDDEDEEDADANRTLDFEAGHGTFISGIVRQICPDADIFSTGVLSSFGDGSIWGLLKSLRRILDIMAQYGGAPDVVVMSFGGYFPLDDPGFLGAALTRLLGDTVIVAAAGNDTTCRPHFPAALPGVVGVGGLSAGGKAWFSNFGGWVDACAPAVDVVSTFFTDFEETIDGTTTRHYEGWARWSGTSFAAPKVAAAIAQEKYLHGITASEAWRRLRSHQFYRYPDLGIVFNV